ncbi:hypothetical protein TNCV_1329051 [Trichonephila clavipes]|nr:hypothetical protein TNCV_1329051 [Trichonephila clavipes]
MKKRKCGTAPEVRRPGAPEGRGLIWLLHQQALAEQNGLHALGGLPGVDTPDVHRPLRPGTPLATLRRPAGLEGGHCSVTPPHNLWVSGTFLTHPTEKEFNHIRSGDSLTHSKPSQGLILN